MYDYIEVWENLARLTLDEQRAWLRTITPLKGVDVDFYGIFVLDSELKIDLLFYISHNKQRI